MNIHPDVAYRELVAERDFLKNRNLALAQVNSELTSMCQQLQAELDATKKDKQEVIDGTAE